MNSETSPGTASARKRSLTEISVDYSDFERLMESIDIDDISDEDRARLEAFEKDLVNERDTKFDNCGGLIKDWEALGTAQKAEGDRIKALGTAKLNKAKFLKLRLLGYFQAHNIDKPIETLRYKFSRQTNGSVPVKLSEQASTKPVELPERYRRVKYEPDLEKIGDDLARQEVLRKTFAALEILRKLGLLDAGPDDIPEDQWQAEYAENVAQLAALGKAFTDHVATLSAEDIASLEIEKKDLDSMLDGVATLGERGEHLRIR